VERTIVGGQVSIAEHAKAAAGAATVEACGVCRCPLREVDAHVSLRHGHGRTSPATTARQCRRRSTSVPLGELLQATAERRGGG